MKSETKSVLTIAKRLLNEYQYKTLVDNLYLTISEVNDYTVEDYIIKLAPLSGIVTIPEDDADITEYFEEIIIAINTSRGNKASKS